MKNDDSHEDGGKKKKREKYIPLYQVHKELNETRERIFLTNEQEVPFRRADNTTLLRRKRDMSKFCRYHRDHGHTTDKCGHLKDEIEGLISRGYLRQYVKN